MRISMIKDRLKDMNKALPGLLFGIIAFGIVCQLIGLLLIDDKADYSIGLWIGVLTAIFMAFHMAITLNNYIELGEKAARAAATRHNLFRYLVVIMIMIILMLTNIGNPLAAFLGVMGLKVSAYLQPLLSKLNHHDQFSQDGEGKIEN